ncbi:MAG: LCP family protein [Acidimicrobiales bacterium]
MTAKRRRHWPRRLLITSNAVVLVLLVLGLSAYGYVQWRLGEVARVHVTGLEPTGQDSQSPAESGGPPMTILMVGSDTRSLGKGASAAFGSAQQVTGQRSDTIVLVRVVPATSSVAILSVPRDLLVNVPGLGTTRINAAFGGGPDLLVKTIQQDLGIDINHFAVVNFATFTKLADALGGVYQYFPTPARDLYSNLVVPHAGCFLLDGSQALAFARSREYQYYLNGSWQYQLVPESDLARIQRQQDFIKLALEKAEHVASTNPFALNRVMSGITGSLTVDSNFSASLMLRLALALRHGNVSGIPNWTYPTANSTVVPGALEPVPSEDEQVTQEFLHHGLPAAKPGATGSLASPAAKPSSVDVQVLNGSGVPGQASQAAGALRAKGFSVNGTGDASSYDYSRSVIEYGPHGLAAAKVLEADVGGSALQEKASLRGDALVLVTGQNFSAANGPASGAPVAAGGAVTTLDAVLADAVPPSTATGPVEPDSSSYYHGQYVPPGLEPGQVPQACPS